MERKLKAMEKGGRLPSHVGEHMRDSEMRRENGALITFFKTVSIYLLFV
jgi:hypothetical protein